MNIAIILAGGSGTRMGSDTHKPFIDSFIGCKVWSRYNINWSIRKWFENQHKKNIGKAVRIAGNTRSTIDDFSKAAKLLEINEVHDCI